MSSSATSASTPPCSSSSGDSTSSTPRSQFGTGIHVLVELRKEDLDHVMIDEVREYCRNQNEVICLQLGRQIFNRRTKSKHESFLRCIFQLPAMRAREYLKLEEFGIISRRQGGEWGRLSAAVKETPLSAVKVHNLDKQISWGRSYSSDGTSMTPYSDYFEQKDEEYLLMIHQDRIVLAEVPLQISSGTAQTGQESKYCALCHEEIAVSDFDTPCLFHPGYKQAIPNASATESDEDSEYDVTSEGEEDDHTAYVLSCCGRRDYEPGCVVESRHLGEDEVESWKIRAQGGLEVYWKHRWAQPEVVENVEKWTPPAV